MDIHHVTPAQAVRVRLFPDGAMRPDHDLYHDHDHDHGNAASWSMLRCFRHGLQSQCLIKVTMDGRTYFASVPADPLASLDGSAGLPVLVERFGRV